MFITFEGGEGSGKSTQLARAADWLEDNGVEILRTREPGGSPSAELIRNLLVSGDVGRWEPITEALLHAAGRAEHLAKTVKPALAHGKIVLSDRYVDSTRAYQGHGHGLGVERIDALHVQSTGGLEPDLTLIFDVSVDIGLARAAKRCGGAAIAEDRYERMGDRFHERVRQGFLAIAAAEPARCVVIDAGQDEDAVHDSVIGTLGSRLDIP